MGRKPPDAGYIHLLGLKNGFHGRHLGEQIMDWAGRQIAAKGRKYLRLDSSPDNAGLCAYYESHGFVRAGTREVKPLNRPSYVAALYERQV